jgi:hypothetical protein
MRDKTRPSPAVPLGQVVRVGPGQAALLTALGVVGSLHSTSAMELLNDGDHVGDSELRNRKILRTKVARRKFCPSARTLLNRSIYNICTLVRML